MQNHVIYQPRIMPGNIYRIPNNPHQRIWRYMDFTKFVALLDSQELFFPRASLFEDSHEGSISQGTIKQRIEFDEEAIRQMKEGAKLDKAAEKRFRDYLEEQRNIKKERLAWKRNWTFINCWHMNDHESAAMWKLYANQSISLQSTYAILWHTLKHYFAETREAPVISMVNYVDYNKEDVPQDEFLSEYVFKRKSFSHEAELRVIIQDIPQTFSEPGMNGWQKCEYLFDKELIDGKSLKIDLNVLIDVIYVAPTCPEWIMKLIIKLLEKYGIHKEVRRSSLDSAPLY